MPPDAVDPAYDYPHSVGQTVIGGYVYRGSKIKALRGIYVFADYLGPNAGDFTGRIFTLNFNGTIASNFQDITADLFPTRGGQFSAAQSVIVRRGRQRRALHRRYQRAGTFSRSSRRLVRRAR